MSNLAQSKKKLRNFLIMRDNNVLRNKNQRENVQ